MLDEWLDIGLEVLVREDSPDVDIVHEVRRRSSRDRRPVEREEEREIVRMRRRFGRRELYRVEERVVRLSRNRVRRFNQIVSGIRSNLATRLRQEYDLTESSQRDRLEIVDRRLRRMFGQLRVYLEY